MTVVLFLIYIMTEWIDISFIEIDQSNNGNLFVDIINDCPKTTEVTSIKLYPTRTTKPHPETLYVSYGH